MKTKYRWIGKFSCGNEDGFSLVELVVVIAIMVILLSMLLPAVQGYIKKAQLVADRAAAKTIYTAYISALDDPEVYAFLRSAKKDAAQGEAKNTGYKYIARSQNTVNGDDKAKVTICEDGKRNGGNNPFDLAMVEFLGTENLSLKTRVKSKNGHTTNEFVILVKGDKMTDIQVWAGCSSGTWKNEEVIRLYPTP